MTWQRVWDYKLFPTQIQLHRIKSGCSLTTTYRQIVSVGSGGAKTPTPPFFPMRRTVHLQEWNKFCLLSSPGLFLLPMSPGTQFRPRSQTPSFMLEPGSPFTPKVCWISFPWKRGKKWKVLQTTGIIDSTVHFTQLGLHRVTASFEQSLKVNCLGPPSFESSYWNKIVQTYPTEVTHRQVACLNPPFPV